MSTQSSILATRASIVSWYQASKSWLLPLLVVAVFVMVWDLWGRLLTANYHQQQASSLGAVTSQTWQVASIDAQQNWLLPFVEKKQTSPEQENAEPAEPEETEVEVMSAEEQAQQQGQLDTLWIGDATYSLLAVFDQKSGAKGSTFAVLTKNIANTKEFERLEVRAGQVLAPYVVENISQRQVLLTAGERHIQLQLFVIKKN